MLKKASAKKRKLISASVAGVLTAAIVAGVTYNAAETAFAKASLPGIEKITQANGYEDPFTILEIVPSYDEARMGYLVSEQEPAYYDSTKGVMAIADMASTAERADRFPTVEADFASTPGHVFPGFDEMKGSAFSWTDTFAEGDDKPKGMAVYGKFAEVGAPTGDYKDNRGVASSYELVDTDPANITIEKVLDVSNTETTGILYMDDVVYEMDKIPATGEERYDLKFVRFADATSEEKLPFRVEYSGTPYFSWCFYLTEDTSAYSAEIVTDDNGVDFYEFTKQIPTNVALYKGSASGVYVYYGHTYTKINGAGEEETWFINADGSQDVPVTDEITNPSLANDVYTSGDLELYRMKEYNSNDSEDKARASQRLYVKEATQNDDYGCVKQTLIDKNVIMKAGQDATQFGVDLEDPLTYHEFYYMPSGTDEFSYDVTHTGTHNFKQSYKEDVINTFNYENGFTNLDWFKQFVLDREPGSECDSTIVDVVTKLPQDVTVDDITEAKLIYIQGGDYSVANDMDRDVAVALLESVYKVNKAVAIEGTDLYEGTYSSGAVVTGADGNPLTNLNNLCVFLQQPRMSKGVIEDYVNAWDDAAKVDTYRTKRVNDSLKKSYTVTTVFVYNRDTIDTVRHIVTPKFNQELRKNDVIDVDATLKLGYKDVIDEIENEKFYLGVSHSDAAFNDKVTIATCIRHILNFGDRRVTSKANIRVLDIEPFYSQVMEDNTELFGNKYYQLNNGTLSDVSNVSYSETSRDIFTKTWFKTNIGTQISNDNDISVKGMGTREFIGNIDDLNANYDLIYIGLDTQYMNTDFVTNGGKTFKGTNTKYNDSSLNGLVYTHIGDTFEAQNEYQGGAMATTGSFKTSGNDITFEKTRELQSYVEAGYAVLLSTDFYTYNADGSFKEVNTAKIDRNSYMYDFAKWVKDKGYLGKNVNVKKNFDNSDRGLTNEARLANQETFSKYLNISKLVVEIVPDPDIPDDDGIPTPYQGLDENNKPVPQYLGMNNTGNYSLDFRVRLTNDAATNRDETTYDCKLYIDHDADGRFEDPVESLNGLFIVDENGNEATYEDGVYKLQTDKIYNISRNVPEGYVGFLAWKLVFYQNNRVFRVDNDNSTNNLVRTAIQGYSAVPDFTNKPTIKILQIFSGDGTYANANDGKTNLDLLDSKMVKLYEDVKDFNISIDQVTAKDFIMNENNRTYSGSALEFLMQYDMVVMGFDDVFDFWDVNGPSDRAMHAIREYILSGRSMLFTHDLNSTHTSRNAWGYLANQYIRDVQGMDRYGVTANNITAFANSYGAFANDYKSRYDNDDGYTDIFGDTSHKSTNANGNLIDPYGWNTSTLLRYHFKSNDNLTANGLGDVALYDANGIAHRDGDFPEYTSTTITRVNQGQITEYPFHIDEQIDVARTHPQYFQLNMDTDSKDDNFDDDIVVWYTISNQNSEAAKQLSGSSKDGQADKKVNYFTANYNDVRNNYYIYNKGNITYTGSGHSPVTGDAEMKLFVNTLVAAYNAGDHAPYARYKESAKNTAVDINAMYIPFDLNLQRASTSTIGGFVGDEITVNFKVINNNLQNNTVKNEDGTYSYKPIYAQYYIPTTNGAGAVAIGKDSLGNTQFYRIITPTSMEIRVDSNNRNLEPGIAPPKGMYILDNYATYQVKFNLSDIVSTTASTVDGKTQLNVPMHSNKIYIRLSMDTTTSEMSQGVQVLPATDSMTPLAINFTDLYELR